MDYQHSPDLLWQALSQADLTIDAAQYRDWLHQVQSEGQSELLRYQELFQSNAWYAAQFTLEQPIADRDLERVLGFGRLITRFMVAPLTINVPANVQEQTIEIGALSNLIVTLFDQFSDNSKDTMVFLPQWCLSLPGEEKSEAIVRQLDREGSTTQEQILVLLIHRYFLALSSMPYLEDRPELYWFLRELIVKMYQVELATLSPNPSPKILRRKSALPFVVMGLPIWLAIPAHSSKTCPWHLRWMYGLGDLIGWVDDWIDFNSDRLDGRPNRLEYFLASKAHTNKEAQLLASGIATRGARLLREWRYQIDEERPAKKSLSGVIPAVIVSWFGSIAPVYV